MQWKRKGQQKKESMYVAYLYVVVFLAGVVAACGPSASDPPTVTPSPTLFSRQESSPAASASTTVPSTEPHIFPGDWPSFLLGKGGYNSSEAAITATTASTLTPSWVAHAGGGISSEPVVVDGTVYWGSWDGYEHATSVTGQARWSTFLGKMSSPQCYPTTAGVASTATVMPITLQGTATLVDFVGGGNAHFYALDAATGNVLWTTSLGSAPGTFIWGSPVLYQGKIYIGTASFGECPGTSGRFFQLDATTGATERILDLVPQGCLGGGVWGSPTIDTDTAELYITTSNASTCSVIERYAMSVIELHTATLSIVGSWQVPDSEAVEDGDFGSTPLLFTANLGGVSRGLVGAVNKNGIFYAFRRGEVSKGPVWRDRISSSPVAGCRLCPSVDEAAAAWDGSRLYVGSTSTTIGGKFCYGSVRALDPATGSYLWERCLSTAYRVLAPPIVVPGLVVASAGPSFFVLDAVQGIMLFSYHDASKDSTFDGAATIAHGVLYIGNLDGKLSAFTPGVL
jgi:outer membrane protein assembly factor BamB